MTKIVNYNQLNGLESKKGAVLEYTLEKKTHGDYDVIKVNFPKNPSDNITFYINTNARETNGIKVQLERLKKFGFTELEYANYIKFTKGEIEFLNVFKDYEYTKDKDAINIFNGETLISLCVGFNNVPVCNDKHPVLELIQQGIVTDQKDKLTLMGIKQLGLSERSKNALKGAKIQNAQQLLDTNEDKLRSIRGIGQVSLSEILRRKKELISQYQM